MFNVPFNFRVIAIISTFNEEDIIIPVINHLFDEDVSVYLIDNWSTDRTFELVNKVSNSDFLIGIERWPKDAPSSTYDWEEILKRKEALSQTLDADWFMHYDADEIRESPWMGISLRDAIYIVDQYGYNAIDFELLNFYPIDNNYQGASLTEYFKYFLFNDFVGNNMQIKAWKRQTEPVNLPKYGGHLVEFNGRKVFPYKFIMRHYPIRSQQHGERKVFSERKPRFTPSETKKNWHIQYNNFKEGTNFLKDPADLVKFEPSFYGEFMIKQTLEREKALEELASQVSEGKSHVARLSQDLGERTSHIAILNQDIATLSNDISMLTSNIATMKELFEEKNNIIKEKNNIIKEKEIIIEEMGRFVKEKENLIEQKSCLVEELNRLVEEKENIINNLFNSRSWLITKPLRKIDALTRKMLYLQTNK